MSTVRVAFVNCLPEVKLPERLSLSRFGEIDLDRVTPDVLARYLHELEDDVELAAVFIGGEGSAAPDGVATLRDMRDFNKTRAYVVGPTAGGRVPDWAEAYDVEDILAPSGFEGFGLSDSVALGLRAYHSLIQDPLYTDFYLDSTYNKIFDWFETTRWDWNEINLDQLNPELLREDELDYLTETAIIEFGTLPGAHNFLREWEGETSFSSWALMWGAEEARHSLVQARYLDRLGVKVRSKHALYKREPYPMGDTRPGTLTMNIISEARAAEYYKRLAADTEEPVIKRIWKLLHRDESRHCRAFTVFNEELCDGNKENQIATLKMAYVWLADRSDGIKHPAGHFYPHSTSANGIRQVESVMEGATDAADNKVLAIMRRVAGDDSIESPRDIKNKLRSMI
ncbi:ferritin-like domain-containing protein [Streptomyces sp. NPDC004647]|uniref:ferritin-like domain-containing protein n=1 Tax=Streptomyces sp. NPDC004647 TaxID=3154671 RepID=UPI0033A348FA